MNKEQRKDEVVIAEEQLGVALALVVVQTICYRYNARHRLLRSSQ